MPRCSLASGPGSLAPPDTSCVICELVFAYIIIFSSGHVPFDPAMGAGGTVKAHSGKTSICHSTGQTFARRGTQETSAVVNGLTYAPVYFGRLQVGLGQQQAHYAPWSPRLGERAPAPPLVQGLVLSRLQLRAGSRSSGTGARFGPQARWNGYLANVLQRPHHSLPGGRASCRMLSRMRHSCQRLQWLIHPCRLPCHHHDLSDTSNVSDVNCIHRKVEEGCHQRAGMR
jgi:hypothetical protein